MIGKLIEIGRCCGIETSFDKRKETRNSRKFLEEQSGLERGMLTGVTERTGEGNVDWRNRTDWRAEC